MIARIWRARALEQNAQIYKKHFRGEVVHKLADIPGFRSAELLCRQEDGVVDLLVQTRWDSMEAVRKFAGESYEQAVVEPAARAVLLDFDDKVQHFEVFASD